MPKTKYFVLWFDPSLFSLILWFSWKKKSWLRLEIRMGVNLIKDSICRSNSIKDRRKVWKSGVSIVVGIICPLVEIGLTDLPKSGGCQTPQDPTGLLIFIAYSFKLNVLILYILIRSNYLVKELWNSIGLLLFVAVQYSVIYSIIMSYVSQKNTLKHEFLSEIGTSAYFKLLQDIELTSQLSRENIITLPILVLLWNFL